MNFTSSNKFNPCSVCSDIKGKCRSKDTPFTVPNHSTIIGQQFFCMSIRIDHNGFKFTGETSDRMIGYRFGLISLGASGGMFAVSPQLLKSYLTQASDTLHTKSILLFPDHNSKFAQIYQKTMITIWLNKDFLFLNLARIRGNSFPSTLQLKRLTPGITIDTDDLEKAFFFSQNLKNFRSTSEERHFT